MRASFTLALSLAVSTCASWAQSSSDELLSGATPVAGEELKSRLSGKSFVWQAPGVPVTARITYGANGEASITLSDGKNDSGPWTVDGGQTCTRWKQLQPTCAREVRIKGELVFLRRGNGTWATMTPN